MKRNSVQKLIKLTDYLNNLPNFTPPSVINYWVDFQNPDYHFLNFNEATIIISSIYFCEDSKLSKWPAVKLCHEFIKSINLSKVGKTIYCHDTLDATEFHDGIGGDIDSFYWISACWKLVWLSTEQCQWLIRDEESVCWGLAVIWSVLQWMSVSHEAGVSSLSLCICDNISGVLYLSHVSNPLRCCVWRSEWPV